MPRIDDLMMNAVIKPNRIIDSQRNTAEALAHFSTFENRSIPQIIPSKQYFPCSVERFPSLLWRVLSDNNNSSIISWCSNGKGFSVHDRKRLISDILPQYYKTRKYASFTRRLNRWGFGCYARGQGSYVFHHALFLRDHPELTLYMSCSKKASQPKPCNLASSLSLRLFFSRIGLPPIDPPIDCVDANHAILHEASVVNQVASLRNTQSLNHTESKPYQIFVSPQSTLVNACVTSNASFSEATSYKAKSIISNALSVLNVNELKCLDMLQKFHSI